MSESLYELIALSARYVFAALMVLIVARAWRLTIIDSRRAKALRRMSPETGICGELVVTRGDERAKRGMKYPVIREGMIGTSRRADIRIRHSSVRRRHAYFQLTPEGLNIRVHAGAPMRNGLGKAIREITLDDGGTISIGDVQLLLVLTEAPEPERLRGLRRRPVREEAGDDEADALFNPDPDQLFRENPILRHGSEPAAHGLANHRREAIENFDDEEEELWWPNGKE